MKAYQLLTTVTVTCLGVTLTLFPARASKNSAINFNESARSCISHDESNWIYFGQLTKKASLFPNDWNRKFPQCGNSDNSSHRQSPIELPARFKKTGENDVQFTTYPKYHFRLEHNCHTVQATIISQDGKDENNLSSPALTIGDTNYWLVQFHIHTPSEHVINSGESGTKNYPAEIHFVHAAKTKDGKLDSRNIAVVGLFVSVAPPKNEEQKRVDLGIQQLVRRYHPKAGTVEVKDVVLDVNRLIGARTKSFYRYDGSLTTPPCSEVVRWVVLQDPIRLSHRTYKMIQVKKLDVGFANARPPFLPTASHDLKFFK